MDKGMHIVDYDVIDYDAWAEKGFESLRESLPDEEFNFYKNESYDIDEVGEQISLVSNHPNYTYIRRKPTWEDVVAELNKPGICDLTINSRALNHHDGFIGHRVVLIDITESEVIFHDPNRDGSGAYRREPLDHFRKVFESIDGPELARYSLDRD